MGFNWIDLQNGNLAGNDFDVENSMTVAPGWFSENPNLISYVRGNYRTGLLSENGIKLNGTVDICVF